MTELTLSASLLTTLVKVLPLYEIEPYEFLATHGIRKAYLEKENYRVPESFFSPALDALANLEAADALGLDLARYTEPASTGALGFACMCSPSLLDAFRRLVQYQTTITDMTHFDLSLDGEWCTVSFRSKAKFTSSYYFLDRCMAMIVRFARMRIGPHVNPVEVRIGRRIIAGLASKFERIARCKVLFDCEDYVVRYDRAIVEETLPATQNSLLQDADLDLKRLLEKRFRTESELHNMVVSILRRRLPGGVPGLKSIASDLHQSERTLQRRLVREGKSYRIVLNDLRRELAMDYSRKRHLSVTDMAILLGFSGTSSFSRWFSGEFGESPQSFQKNEERRNVNSPDEMKPA